MNKAILQTKFALGVVILIVACGQPRNELPPLSNASGSPESVCQRVLDAIALNDTLGLQALIVNRFEHDSILVPHMPIGKGTTGNKDLELAWFMLDQRSIKGVRRALADHGGTQYQLVSVDFAKPTETHGPVRLHKGTTVRVRDVNDEEMVLGIFGSILESNGQYKLVSIRD